MSDAPRSVPVLPPPSKPTPSLADLPQTLPLPDQLAKLLPPDTYLVEGFLGQGGMGAVYRGVQISLNRPVAIKILQLDIGEGHDFADRFRREARAMAALTHPNIVNVYDFGAAGGKYLYLVMECVEGSDLFQVMRAKQMTPELALYLVPQICDALAYAHEHGIVHRDIKPANIMLTQEWQVKVADFGLAKRLEKADTLVTRSNMSMGTPDYAAPEQFEMDVAIDHRADIYALGVTFYQMLTGELPRGAWQLPSAMVKTDPRLDPIVTKAMMPKRDQRYQSARELQRSVIGFTQTLAREQQQRTAAAGANARLEARKKTSAASSGKVAATGSRRADTPFGASQPVRSDPSPLAKMRVPVIPVAIAAAAVLGIGAFFLFGGRKDEPPVAPSPSGFKAATTTVPRIKAVDDKPASSAKASPGSSSFTPGKWVPVKFTEADVSGATGISIDGDKLVINNGWKALPGRVPQARNIVLRAHVTHPAEYKPVQFWLRTQRQGSESSNAMSKLVMDSYINADAKLNWWNPTEGKSRSLASLKGGQPMSRPAGAQLTFAAVDDMLMVQRDGKTVLTTRTDTGPQRGVAVLHSSGRSEFTDIEVMILDGVPREQWPDFVREAMETKGKPAPVVTAPSSISNIPSSTSLDAPGWKRLDLAKVQEARGKVERLPDGAVRLTKGFIWTDTAHPGDAAIRARFRGTPDPVNQRLMVRDDASVCYSANIPAKRGKGDVFIFARGDSSITNRTLAGFTSPDTTKTFTLELRAQGSTLTVLVDGKQVARAQDGQLKFGRLGVFADRGIVEGIAYQAGDAAAPADDEAGWQKLDLATITLAKTSVSMSDGAIKLTRSFAWSPQIYEDVQVRVRFRSGAKLDTPRILARDRDGIAYAMSHQNLFSYVWGGDALARDDAAANRRNLAQLPPLSENIQIMELYVRGDQLTGFINGKKVAEARDGMLKSGRVGFYANEGIVESFEIKPLSKDRAALQPGELVWKTEVGGSVIGPASQGADGTLYVGVEHVNSGLMALNAKDGGIVWKARLAGRPREGMAPVVADDGSVLIVVHGEGDHAGKGVLHCIDGASGRERWTFSFDEGGPKAHFADSSVAVSADGKVFLQHKAAYCIDLASGRQLWTMPFPGETSNVAPLIAENGTVVFPAGQLVLALNPLNGAILWQSRLLGACYGDAAIDGGTLLVAGVATPTGSLRGYDILTGQMRWETKLGEKIDTSLALDARGRVFTCSTNRHVVACDAATGSKVWEVQQGTSRPRGFAIGADGFVYTTFDKQIVCLKPDNGEIVWRVPANDVIWGAPLLLDDGLLITGSRDKKLYAIQTSSKGLADSPWPTMGQNNRRNGRAAGAQIVVAQDTPTDKKLREIEAKARAEYDAGPGKFFGDAVSTLGAQYTNALKARATQSQREGNLDHMLAFNEEAEAFASGKRTAPPVEAPGTPAALKQLRETFRKTLAGYEANRDKTSAPIYAKWDAALAALQSELTKASEINEALRVKKLRDQIVITKALTLTAAGGSDPGGTASTSANPGSVKLATATPPSRPAAKTTAPAPKVGKVNQRKLAEWVLSVPGSEIQCFKSDGKTWGPTIKKAADLPQTEIEFVKVMLSDAASAKEADMLQLASCQELRDFRVQGNGFNCITPAVIAALGRNAGLQVLTLYGVNLEDADFAPLERCKELKAFRIADAPRFTGQALSYLPAATIDALELRNCPVTDDALPFVARMTQLNQVNLVGLQITEALFDRLPPGKLTDLRLAKMPQLKGRLAAVKRFPKLEVLEFGYWSGVNGEEAAVIAGLPNLRRLGATGLVDDVLPLLAANKDYEQMSLQPSSGTPTTFKGLSVFAQHRKLKDLTLVQLTSAEALEGVATLEQLERLAFSQCNSLTDASMSHVAKLAKLTKLGLDRSPITDVGLEPLKAMKKLQELDLTGTKVTRDGAAAIKKALPKCKVVGP